MLVDAWMDGQIGGWVDGWMDGWMDKQWLGGWTDFLCSNQCYSEFYSFCLQVTDTHAHHTFLPKILFSLRFAEDFSWSSNSLTSNLYNVSLDMFTINLAFVRFSLWSISLFTTFPWEINPMMYLQQPLC